jgi:peroxisomal membrane protein 4
MISLADEIQAIVAALVGGARYGIKIRLPHAVVMTLLFRRDLTSKQKVQSVVKLALEHASNLAAFATIYKVCCM